MLALPLAGMLMLTLQPLHWCETSLQTSLMPGMEMRRALTLQGRLLRLHLTIGWGAVLPWHALLRCLFPGWLTGMFGLSLLMPVPSLRLSPWLPPSAFPLIRSAFSWWPA